jgi:hypothetical protein
VKKLESLLAINPHDRRSRFELAELKPGPIGYLFYGVYSGIKWLFVRD